MADKDSYAFCTHCGKPMSVRDRFCAACGMACEQRIDSPVSPRHAFLTVGFLVIAGIVILMIAIWIGNSGSPNSDHSRPTVDVSKSRFTATCTNSLKSLQIECVDFGDNRLVVQSPQMDRAMMWNFRHSPEFPEFQGHAKAAGFKEIQFWNSTGLIEAYPIE